MKPRPDLDVDATGKAWEWNFKDEVAWDLLQAAMHQSLVEIKH